MVESGLGCIHNYFSKPNGPAVIFPNIQGLRHSLEQV
jgi:hypothetical protein